MKEDVKKKNIKCSISSTYVVPAILWYNTCWKTRIGLISVEDGRSCSFLQLVNVSLRRQKTTNSLSFEQEENYTNQIRELWEK
jgi:hypothetical protein